MTTSSKGCPLGWGDTALASERIVRSSLRAGVSVWALAPNCGMGSMELELPRFD